MPNEADIRWFKSNFRTEIEAAIAGTPLTLDLITAIACQETGYIWATLLRRGLPKQEILELCVGDSIDAPRRKAFPKTKAALTAEPGGQQMFAIARDCLVRMSTHIPGYGSAVANPDKFCHGFGIFQSDLQFFKTTPDFFLGKQWADFSKCLARAIAELKQGLSNLGYAQKPALTRREQVFVAIVYNIGFGNFKESRGYRQGFEDEDGVFYGEHIDQYLTLASHISVDAAQPVTYAAQLAAPAAIFVSAPDAGGAASGATALAAAANQEFATYKEQTEDEEPLRSRIREYFNLVDLPSANPSSVPWSASFISFCVHKSGATSSEFKFSAAHSVFVYAAIRNAIEGRGVFRGHPIDAYKPKIGDIVHHNRGGTSYDFDYAAANHSYQSHSAIIVDFETVGGQRYFVTIGGNETDGIRRKRFPLTPSGYVAQR